jgi:superfamily II DNA/RNA helicase
LPVGMRADYYIGRTGRFGRKGISINFVHDKKTWLQMEQIEKLLGKKIIRIETNDLDDMEEVRLLFLFLIVTARCNGLLLLQKMKKALK